MWVCHVASGRDPTYTVHLGGDRTSRGGEVVNKGILVCSHQKMKNSGKVITFLNFMSAPLKSLELSPEFQAGLYRVASPFFATSCDFGAATTHQVYLWPMILSGLEFRKGHCICLN